MILMSIRSKIAIIINIALQFSLHTNRYVVIAHIFSFMDQK